MAGALSVGVSALQAVLFGAVGSVFLRGSTVGGARSSREAMATWWYALALTTAAGGLLQVVSLITEVPVQLATDATLLNMAALCAGLAGLLYYLAYLATGWARLLWPITLAYAAVFAWLSLRVAAWNPVGVGGPSWNVQVVYANAPDRVTTMVLLLVLVAPELIAAAALGAVAARLPPGPSRQRAVVLSASILVWFGASLAGQLAGAPGGIAWSLAQRLLGVAATLAVLSVYRVSGESAAAPAGATGARSAARGE